MPSKAEKRSRRNQYDSAVTSVQRYRDFIAPAYWPTWLAIGGVYLLAWIPITLRLPLCRALAVLFYWLVPQRRRVVNTNIALCFPQLTEQQQRQLVRETYVSNTLSFFETAHAWCRSVDNLQFDIQGFEHFQQALADGNGVIAMSGHFGPIDILGALFNGKTRFSVMHRKHDNPLFNYFMTRARENFCDDTIARKDLKGLLRVLKQGKAVWYAPDQDYGRKASVFVPFFAIPTATITMTSKLVKATGAKVIPMSAYRTADCRGFVVKFEPPMRLGEGDDVADARAINQWLEARIQEHPAQYLWLHKRFKTRPEGEPSLY